VHKLDLYELTGYKSTQFSGVTNGGRGGAVALGAAGEGRKTASPKYFSLRNKKNRLINELIATNSCYFGCQLV